MHAGSFKKHQDEPLNCTVLMVCSEDHLLFLCFKASPALYETVTESEVSLGEKNVFKGSQLKHSG